MAIDEKALKALSNALGLGDTGLVADKAGAVLAYQFTDKPAATTAKNALENLDRLSLKNFASVTDGEAGKYKLVISEAALQAIADIKIRDLGEAKELLQKAMQQDKTAVAVIEKKSKESDEKFAALNSGVRAEDMSFETRAYAERLSTRINRATTSSSNTTSNSLTTVKQGKDGRWVVEFNKEAIGKSDRSVEDIVKDVRDFKPIVQSWVDFQKPNIAALGTALGVNIRQDGDANYIKTEGMPDKTVDTIVSELNGLSAGIATKAKDRIVINEEVLTKNTVDFINLSPKQQVTLERIKDLIVAGNKLSDDKVSDQSSAPTSQKNVQVESDTKAITKVNSIPTEAKEKAEADVIKADAAALPPAVTPPTTGGSGTVTAPATTPAAAPPAEKSDFEKNMFTIIGAAIPALLMFAGIDMLPALLLMAGGLLIGGMFDKEKGGLVGQMIGKVMGKDDPTLDGMDTSKDKSLSRDELATALNKNADNKLDAKELSALSDGERKKLFDALQANKDNKDAVKIEDGKMVEVDLDRIKAPINLPAATPASGPGTAAGK